MTRYAPGAPTRSIREEAVDANASVSEVFLPVGKSGGGAAAKKKLRSKLHKMQRAVKAFVINFLGLDMDSK